MIKKVIVAGSREFTDEKKVHKVLNKLKKEADFEIEIVSGLCRGPDMFGKNWAEKNNLKCHKYPANWNKYGKRAGFIRNEEMAKVGDILIAFHVNNSKGTQHMINLAIENGLKVKVFVYKM